MKWCVEVGWGEELLSSWRVQCFPCPAVYVNWVMPIDYTTNNGSRPQLDNFWSWLRGYLTIYTGSFVWCDLSKRLDFQQR